MLLNAGASLNDFSNSDPLKLLHDNIEKQSFQMSNILDKSMFIDREQQCQSILYKLKINIELMKLIFKHREIHLRFYEDIQALAQLDIIELAGLTAMYINRSKSQQTPESFKSFDEIMKLLGDIYRIITLGDQSKNSWDNYLSPTEQEHLLLAVCHIACYTADGGSETLMRVITTSLSVESIVQMKLSMAEDLKAVEEEMRVNQPPIDADLTFRHNVLSAARKYFQQVNPLRRLCENSCRVINRAMGGRTLSVGVTTLGLPRHLYPFLLLKRNW